MDDRELKILEDLKEGPIRLRSGLITKYRYNEKNEFYIALSNLKEKGLIEYNEVEDGPLKGEPNSKIKITSKGKKY